MTRKSKQVNINNLEGGSSFVHALNSQNCTRLIKVICMTNVNQP